jgi:hypothetical protein
VHLALSNIPNPVVTLLSLQVMSAYLGAPTAILQEHGSTAATATPLVGKTDTGGATATAVATGIIRWAKCCLSQQDTLWLDNDCVCSCAQHWLRQLRAAV